MEKFGFDRIEGPSGQVLCLEKHNNRAALFRLLDPAKGMTETLSDDFIIVPLTEVKDKITGRKEMFYSQNWQKTSKRVQGRDEADKLFANWQPPKPENRQSVLDPNSAEYLQLIINKSLEK